jgi:hypothetical protein
MRAPRGVRTSHLMPFGRRSLRAMGYSLHVQDRGTTRSKLWPCTSQCLSLLATYAHHARPRGSRKSSWRSSPTSSRPRTGDRPTSLCRHATDRQTASLTLPRPLPSAPPVQPTDPGEHIYRLFTAACCGEAPRSAVNRPLRTTCILPRNDESPASQESPN